MSNNLIETVKSSVVLVGGAGTAQVLNFAGTIMAAYLFGPFEFGIYAIFVSIHTMLVSVVTMRFELALVVENRMDIVYDLFCMSSLLLFFFSGTILLGVLVVDFETLNEVGRRAAFFLLPFSVFFAGQYVLASQWCARHGDFRRMALAAASIPAATVLAQYAGHFLSATSGSLIAGYLCGQIVGVAVLWGKLATTVDLKRLARHLFRWSRLARSAWKHRRFALYQMPNSLASAAYLNLPSVILGTLASPEAAGAFSLAFRAVFQPLALLPAAFGQVVFAKMSRSIDRLGEWESSLANAYILLGLLFAFPCALVMCFGESASVVALGKEWALAGTLAQFIVLPCVMMALAAGYDRLYDVVGAQKPAFFLSVGSALIVVSTSYFIIWATRDIHEFSIFFSIFHLLYSFVWTIFAIMYCNYSMKAAALRWLGIVSFVLGLAGSMYVAMDIISSRLISVLIGFFLYMVSLLTLHWIGVFSRYGRPVA